MLYSIGEFAALTQLGIHTLRYYEQENLISPARSHGNRRIYSDKDLLWIEFIKRLKATDMPLKQIKYYARLRAEGDSTLRQRLELLLQHRERLIARIDALKEHQLKLDEKIGFYRQTIKAKKC